MADKEDYTIRDIRRCDFCNSLPAPYLWVFQSQIIPAGTPMEFLESLMTHPEWFACEVCHQIILTKNLTALLDRAQAAEGKDNFPDDRRPWFAQLYASLIENLQRN